MLNLYIKECEFFNNSTNEFFTVPECVLRLEHSLKAVAKWESKWGKPFLSKDKMSDKEVKDYIKCMLIDEVPYIDLIINNLSATNEEIIANYIDSKMTATWFSDDKNQPKNNKVITSEIIYYWMIAQNIPLECENWHLNRLLTLIKVCSIENSPKKKMSKGEEARNRAALNKARRMRSGSKG